MSSTAQTLLLALFVGSKIAYGVPTAPAPSSTPEYSISQVAEFDNIAGVAGTSLSPVGSNGIYQNLKFPGWTLIQTLAPATGELPLLIPQSAPNIIGFSTASLQGLLGGKSFLFPSHIPPPSTSLLHVKPTQTRPDARVTDSSTDYFNLTSFYYGCTAATQATVVGVPVSCTITVTGYGAPSAGSPQLAQQSFSFAANGLNQDMVKGVLSSAFAKLYSATFTVQATVSAATVGFLDNVATTISSKSPVTVN